MIDKTQTHYRRSTMSRRTLLVASSGAAGLWALTPRLAGAQSLLSTTPSCTDTTEPTPRATQGPYFSPDSPERSNIREGRYDDQELMVGGYILDQSCRPIPGALIEIWQADPDGNYDTAGNHLRGHQITAADGRWIFSTVMPGPYRPRARHIHLKVQRRNGEVLTTQMFFPGDPTHAQDRQFDPRLVAAMVDAPYTQARMDIVLL